MNQQRTNVVLNMNQFSTNPYIHIQGKRKVTQTLISAKKAIQDNSNEEAAMQARVCKTSLPKLILRRAKDEC